MNGKFAEKYGISWEHMDNERRQMAIMSEIFDLREDIQPIATTVKELCKQSDANKLNIKESQDRIKLLIWFIGIVSVPVVGWLVTNILETVRIIK